MFTDNPCGKLVCAKKRSLLPPEEVKLHLLDMDGSDLGLMTLKSAHSYIKPFTHLTQAEPRSDGQYFQIKPLRFYNRELPGDHLTNRKAYKRAGRGKEFHLTTETTAPVLTHVLNKSSEYLLQGARMQFSLHQPHTRDKKGPPMEYALANSPQLRPDTILRAMPEGTTMLAHPCIASEAMRRVEIKAGVDPPLLWAMEHEPSLRRLGTKTPTWIKQMATWDVTLKLNPELNNRQQVKTMWNYSKRIHRWSKKPPTVQPPVLWNTGTPNELVP